MSALLPLLSDDETRAAAPHDDEPGCGALRTDRGLLPLTAVDVSVRIDGLLAETTIYQTFFNAFDVPLEATYLFPLPDRAAVAAFRLEVAGRVVEGRLKERGQARRDYDAALRAGHRAALTEEERPNVFSLRIGNLPPGETATVRLVLAGPLPFADGEATYRFPLVVAPRYVPGRPYVGPHTGPGVAPDTDAVPDASRVTPPVLLPGFPNPVRLALAVEVAADALPLLGMRSSLHAVVEEDAGSRRLVRLRPGERLNRDFVLRLRYDTTALRTSLAVFRDAEGDEGTFALTVVPPAESAAGPPRDVVFLLDRSGSMEGWKMVAARRALARLVETLTERDRFAVLLFDDRLESPSGLSLEALTPATDRARFRAAEGLHAVAPRGGTEMLPPLDRGLALLQGEAAGRDRVLVLLTDGQVANEDQILRVLGSRLAGVRVFALGIDRAVNEGFLNRLTAPGGGGCSLVESEGRLDEVMAAVARRVGPAAATGLTVASEGLEIVEGSLVPGRPPDLFSGVPAVLLGRCRGDRAGAVVLQGRDSAGQPWRQAVAARPSTNAALTCVWARGHLRQREDRYLTEEGDRAAQERAMVAASLRFGVLCRFTAFVAVDRAETVNEGGGGLAVVQPVEPVDGWDMCMRALPAGPNVPCAPSALPRTAGMRTYSAPPARALTLKGLMDTDFDAEEGSPPRPATEKAQPLRRLLGGLRGLLRGSQDILAPLRARARKLARRLGGSPSLGGLSNLDVPLAHLVADARAAGVKAAEVEPLARAADALRAVLTAAPTDAALVARVWAEVRQALEAFATGSA